MMQLQFRFTQHPDGLVKVEMDRFGREDATEGEREILNRYHTIIIALMEASAHEGQFEAIGESNPWISVAERLPAVGRVVPVACLSSKDEPFIFSGWIGKNGEWFTHSATSSPTHICSDSDEFSPYKTTHDG